MATGISKKLKWRVWDRDRGKCFYCNCIIPRKGGAKDKPVRTLDHVIPRSKGGPGHMWNLVLSCPKCNQDKGSNDPTEEHLAIAIRRRQLNDLLISLGKYVGYKKALGDMSDVPKLIKSIEIICEILMARKSETDLPYSIDELSKMINFV
jgi:hypothetical protein